VAASSSGPDRTRTLVLRQGGGVLSYAVLRNTDPVLGEPELAEAPSVTHALDAVVGSLDAAATGDGGDAGQALGQFDIGYVLLPAPVDQSLAHQLDAAAGLVPLTEAPAYDLWQVTGPVARARVISADGAVLPVPSGPIGAQAVIPAGISGTLVLAEAAGGWSATLNSRPLDPLAEPVDGWAQGFVLPAGGGRLVITRDETARHLSLAVEAAAVLVVFALALPGTGPAAPLPAAGTEAPADPDAALAPGRRRDEGQRSGRFRRPQVAAAASGSPPQPDEEAVPVPVPAAAASGPDRRPRGAQRAARHGKPPRRWRASPAGKPAAGSSDPSQPPAPPDPDADSFPADADVFSPALPDPAAAGPRSRPPWELGDRP